MSISSQDLEAVRFASLPSVFNLEDEMGPILRQQQACGAVKVEVKASVLATSRATVSQMALALEDGSCILISRTATDDLFGQYHHFIEDQKFEISGENLIFGAGAKWQKHPALLDQSAEILRETVLASWTGGIQFKEEIRDASGEIVGIGLRSPQVGALHAIAAHWSVSSKPGLVVMPTGTGKTEVMLSCFFMKRPKRLLVLVPSDALRLQTFKKFLTLGKLRELGILGEAPLNPVVARIKGGLSSADELTTLEQTNVVVSTVASLAAMPRKIAWKFKELFDVVFFDEAHHTPSNTWETLLRLFEKQQVLMFTATPFREDGRRIPGRIIYNFPLRLAQAQGLFRKIKFVEVFQPDTEQSDRDVAEAAVKALRADLNAGYDHMLLARTDTKVKAQEIFQMYASRFGDLSPIVIYSGIAGFKERMKEILLREHRIIVCVDMFGEGFDLPNLKIAALHAPHKSLAVTLQFCGRFTRDSKHIGDATLVANIADTDVSDAVEELYAEDSDWNELIPELSSKAIDSQVNFSDFLDRMERSDKGEEELFDLNVLRPKTSTVIYKTASFQPRKFRKGIRASIEVERQWVSKDKDLLIFITKSRVPIEWAEIKETSHLVWDLYVVAFDAESGLLFIHSSVKKSLHHDLATAVGGKASTLIDGEVMFRAFSGINRLIFHNAGLYRKGAKLRFRMYTGLDVGEAISPSAQIGSSKSNLFGVGYFEGKKVSVGVSYKGRVWSMSSSSVPDWRVWCSAVGSRVMDESISTQEYLRHTLIPEEIGSLPDSNFFTAILPVEMYSSDEVDFRIFVGGQERNFHDFEITRHQVVSTNEVLLLTSQGDLSEAEFKLTWGPSPGQFEVQQIRGDTLEIQQGTQRQSLSLFFRENPPALFAVDGSEVRGGSYLKSKKELEFSFFASDISVGNWSGIDITKESKWKNGVRRDDTVQAALIASLLAGPARFIVDDDDTGEAADVIEIIEENEVVSFHLYHCKFSSGGEPGLRVKDCYEVCGQAVRSVRWTENATRLIEHIRERERSVVSSGRQTRFEKGDLRELVGLRKRVRKLRTKFSISIVQPGISKSKFEPEIATILGSADSFIREFTGRSMRVIGSQ